MQANDFQPLAQIPRPGRKGNSEIPKRDLLIYGASALIAGGIFVLDLMTPMGVVEWIFYLLPVVVSYWTAWRIYPIVVALVSAILMLMGFIYSPPGIDPKLGLINRGAGTLMIAQWQPFS